MMASACRHQMATRFAATDECSAAPAWKQKYIDATGPESICIIQSPVGMPGRAMIDTEFTRKALQGRVKIDFCDHCLRKCNKNFCIILALINAQKGDVENGIVFSGANGWKVKGSSRSRFATSPRRSGRLAQPAA
jgi:NAD(P)H-dependent flavin oxidoreductase YrpB (nitropropane dioxygenase family)